MQLTDKFALCIVKASKTIFIILLFMHRVYVL